MINPARKQRASIKLAPTKMNSTLILNFYGQNYPVTGAQDMTINNRCHDICQVFLLKFRGALKFEASVVKVIMVTELMGISIAANMGLMVPVMANEIPIRL